MKRSVIIILLLIVGCKQDYTALLDKKEKKEYVKCSKDNKFIGTYDNSKNNNSKIYRTIVYDNYIVFEPIIGNLLSGFEVYKNDRSIDYTKYKNPIIKKFKEEFFMGIYKNYLFIDSGTGPGIRGLEIYDLESRKTIYRDIWDGEKLEFVDDDTIAVPKYYNESEPEDKRGWSRKYYLHSYLFNLKTLKLVNQNKKYFVISN